MIPSLDYNFSVGILDIENIDQVNKLGRWIEIKRVSHRERFREQARECQRERERERERERRESKRNSKEIMRERNK